MNWLDRFRIANYHRKRNKQYANDNARTLGWQDNYSQLSRFEALCRDVELDGACILDVGCGYGDLLEYIELSGARPKRYIGIDQHRAFISQARQRSFYSDARFICDDFSKLALPSCDYVFASGSLNYQSSNANHTTDMIARMYQSAHRACAFNLLDEAKLPSMKMLASHNKEGVLRYSRWLSPNAYLIEGYSEHDFTVFMPKL
ncbi:class I SAM-dependent methyltransferase [Vibrio alfacsensis]|uniref:class I SAM-dependent methyltransferase n=1 Tax=Vibrio alfacsensis TaxID=1074311 RepID=UPI00406871DE